MESVEGLRSIPCDLLVEMERNSGNRCYPELRRPKLHRREPLPLNPIQARAYASNPFVWDLNSPETPRRHGEPNDWLDEWALEFEKQLKQQDMGAERREKGTVMEETDMEIEDVPGDAMY